MNKPCDKPVRPYRTTPYLAENGPPCPEPARTFWMVYVAEHQSPAKRHYDLKLARSEANRLARKELGKLVYVLQAVHYCQAPEPDVDWHDCSRA